MMNQLVRVFATALLAVALSPAAVMNFETVFAPEAVGATGSGSGSFIFDTTLQTLSIDVNWAGLSGTTTVAHIHCCVTTAGTGTVGVAVTPTTLPGFPVGVGEGSYAIVLDLTNTATYTAAFLNGLGGGTSSGASAALLQGILDGKAYFNIHTTPNFPGGEIRGFLAPVPEPGTFMLAGFALAGLMGLRRLRAK